MSASTAKLVALEYGDLVAEKDLTAQIEEAFSFDGLGILTVVNVPGFAEKRRALLPLARRFAELPAEVKVQYECPEAFYNCGWSHGREKLQGKPDYAKGSFYANPMYDRPVDDEALIEKFASFVAPNIWPTDAVPDLEPAFKDLGRMMVELGTLVARQCDLYVKKQCPGYVDRKLVDVIRHSKCCKGRLLHYFAQDAAASAEARTSAAHVAVPIFFEPEIPPATAASSSSSSSSSSSENSSPKEHRPLASALRSNTAEGAGVDDQMFSDWCGWHNDHGSLTALVPAMYLTKDGAEIPCPDPSAGLYIRNRSGELVKAVMPKNGGNNLLFQIGETAQIHTGGLLQATPHAVRGMSAYADGRTSGVTRETFAVFMEPNWDGDMNVPDGRTGAQAQTQAAAAVLPAGVPPLGKRWSEGMNFGEFTERTFSEFY